MAVLMLLVVACINAGTLLPGGSLGGVEPPSDAQMANVCGTDRELHSGMDKSSASQLRKLAEYERVCDGAFVGKQMFFTRMPESADEAGPLAVSMVTTLKEFAKYSISPLIVFEPTTADGAILPVKDFHTGLYDAALASYFQTLKDHGITDDMMGMWVPFPEANTPTWHTTDPKAFVANINYIVGMQKQYFPDSEASVLLNSQSYPDNDDNWSHGAYTSLVPYVRGIKEGLIDSFGYQGFPWLPPANEATDETATLKADQFLRPVLAEDAADTLGTQNIWLNTGTFGKAHATEEETVITMGSHAREVILKDILAQVKILNDKGYVVAVHVFTEDKSATTEATDWSYWTPGAADESDATSVFRAFVRSALLNHVPLWLYDDDHQAAAALPSD